MIGTTLSHYEILEEIGRGGMGIVYKAADTKLDRIVAIKVLPQQALANQDDRDRFYREAKAAAALHHPNIASVFEIDEATPEGSKDPHPFIAMEYIDGQTLKDKIDEGPLKLRETIRIISQVGEGLRAAHSKEIVHRDIKSANIMVTSEGTAKILDFGLAKTAQSTMLTQMGSTLGTVAYMSPEQARSEEVDHRTDIWALGAVLFETITGRHPFPGDYEQAIIYGILNQDPEPITALRTGVPMGLEWIVNKMLAKEKGDRYQSVADLLVDLKNVDLSASEVRRSGITPPVDIAETASAPEKSGQSPLVIGGIALVALLIGVLGGMFLLRPSVTTETSLSGNALKRLNLFLPDVSSIDQPILSPNGRYLAVIELPSEEDKEIRVIYDLETNRRTVISDAGFVLGDSFSPDSEWFMFSDLQAVYRIRTDGTDRNTVFQGAGLNAGSFGPDGSILLWSVGPTLTYIPEIGDPIENFLVADTSASEAFLIGPRYYPVIDKLFYQTSASSFGDSLKVWLYDFKTEKKTLVIRDAWFKNYLPTGHLIYTEVNNDQIMAQAFDVESAKFVGPRVALEGLVEDDVLVAISDDGTLVRFQKTVGPEYQLVRKDISTGIEEILLARIPDLFFDVSGGGDKIVTRFKRSEEGDGTISVLELNSGVEIPVADGSLFSDPVWHPDGERITLIGTEEGKSGIFLTSATGMQEPTQIVPLAMIDQQVDWSADGRTMVWHDFNMDNPDNTLDIFAYDDSTGLVRRLPGDESIEVNPEISPNGKFVIYASVTQGDDFTLFLRHIEDNRTWNVWQEGADRYMWSPDGSSIHIARNDTIFKLNVQADSTFRILGQPEVLDVLPNMGRFEFLENGNVIYSRELEKEKQTYVVGDVVINWFEELKRKAPRTQE